MRVRVPTFAKATVGQQAGARIRLGDSPFHIFQQFPELHIKLFAKEDHYSSNEECAHSLGFSKVATLNQVHGNTIHVMRESLSPPPEGDGIITDVPGLALSVRFADCQAFVVYAPKRCQEPSEKVPDTFSVIGMLHAGWRGMAAHVITKFFEGLEATFDIAPAETFIYAAPSLCKECATFSDPMSELPEHLHRFTSGKNVDLIAAAEAEFDALGVPRGHRERHPSCTKCDPQWWSYRRGESGRNYLIAGLDG